MSASFSDFYNSLDPDPRDHQNEARTAVVLGLQSADRGQLIRMPGQKFFGTDIQNTWQCICDEHRPSGALRTDFVSGNMPTNKRKIKLDERNLRSAFTT